MIIFNKNMVIPIGDVSSQPVVKRNTPKKRNTIKSLNKDNKIFLKSLGFKVKKQ